MYELFIVAIVGIIVVLIVAVIVIFVVKLPVSNGISAQSTLNNTVQPLQAPGTLQLVEKKTSADEAVYGNSLYLDRHNALCDANSVLNSWHAINLTNDQIEVDYTCAYSSAIGPAVASATPLNDDGSGNVAYFDRHDISCPSGQAIGRVHLVEDNNQIKFEYDCRTVPNLNNCVKKITTASDNNSSLLSSHNVKCEGNQVLTRMHLNRVGDSQIQYEYTCCSELKK
jgi:hypothetical protein